MNTTLRELKGLKGPTVAFHVRGGDLLADLTSNVRFLYNITVRKKLKQIGFQIVSRLHTRSTKGLRWGYAGPIRSILYTGHSSMP